MPVGTIKNVLDPKPVPPSLAEQFKVAVRDIPAGKTGAAKFTVTTSGMEVIGGVKKTIKKVDVTGAGWAGKEWGSGWSAGGQVGLSF